MKSKELSSELITHKLKIKWEWIKYISNKVAESIFNQLSDQSKNTITIANTKNFTYITKYRSEIDLVPLDKENSNFEDLLYSNWLTESQKDRVREIRELRKKSKQPRTNWILKNIIIEIKKNY